MEDAQIAAASRELHAATVEANALRAAIVNLERSQGPSDALFTGGKQNVPAEFRDSLNRDLNAYKKAKAERVATEALKKKADEVLQAAQRNAQAASEEATAVLDAVVDSNTFRLPAEVASTVETKRRELEALVNEHDTLQRTSARNLASIKQLAAAVDELADMDWELYRIKAEVGIKETQLQSVVEESNSIRRIFDRKTALLNRLSTTDISTDVHLLAHHKVSEQKKLLAHKEHSVKGMAATRHGAVSVKLHEDKLRLVGSAAHEVLRTVTEIEDDAADCDAHEVDDIRRQIQTAQDEEHRVQLAIDYYDNQIRNFEARVEILQHATEVRHRDIAKDETSLAKRCEALAADVEKQKASAQGLLENRKKSVSQLRSALK